MKEILTFISAAAIPLLIALIITHGLYKKVPVYEVFIQGAKQGLLSVLKLFPIWWP